MTEPAPKPGTWASAEEVLDYALGTIESNGDIDGAHIADALQSIGRQVTLIPADNEVLAHFISTGDRELDTIQALVDWLEPLGRDGQRRVLAWLTDRFSEPVSP